MRPMVGSARGCGGSAGIKRFAFRPILRRPDFGTGGSSRRTNTERSGTSRSQTGTDGLGQGSCLRSGQIGPSWGCGTTSFQTSFRQISRTKLGLPAASRNRACSSWRKPGMDAAAGKTSLPPPRTAPPHRETACSRFGINDGGDCGQSSSSSSCAAALRGCSLQLRNFHPNGLAGRVRLHIVKIDAGRFERTRS